MKTLQVTPNINSKYDIIIGENLLEKAGELAIKCSKSNKFFIITNTTVSKLYLKKLTTSIENSGAKCSVFELKDGEEFKNMTSLNSILDSLCEAKTERKDTVIALGGGVVGDISGFAAACYLRGIDFIQIPTTLLAQVDSSVGGKTAVNNKSGKNLIGAFYQPILVLADITTLKTLPKREFKTGLAEVIKYAFIEKTCGYKDQINFLEFLENNIENIKQQNSKTISELVLYCCKLKASVVNQDEKEKGLRAILNLGHTIAHSIEKATNYNTFTHGEAVAMGLKAVFDISAEMDLITPSYHQRAISLLDSFNLNYKIPQEVELDLILDAMKLDKKVQDSKIRFIMPLREKEVFITDKLSAQTIQRAIQRLY